MSGGHFIRLTLDCIRENCWSDNKSCEIHTFKKVLEMLKNKQCIGSPVQKEIAL